MKDHALHNFIQQASEEIASEYRRIYSTTTRDPGTAGDEGEENWAALLRNWLPAGYHVATKGQLIGRDGSVSPQVDIVVLKPSYPLKLREKRKWLAGGVAAAFECKNTLTAADVKDAVDRCIEFKALFPKGHGTPRKELRSPLVFGLLAHSHSWKARRSTPIQNIDDLLTSASASAEHPRELIDVLCVADLAIWRLGFIPAEPLAHTPWHPAHKMIKAAPELFGPATLFNRSVKDANGNLSYFEPLGGLFEYMWRQLGWNDPSLREIADYYQSANLQGGGYGELRRWPMSVYSQSVAAVVNQRAFRTMDRWDEWALASNSV